MQWNTVITGIVYFQNMITLYLKTVLIKCLKSIKCCIHDTYSLKGVFREALSRIFALFWPMKKNHYHLASFFFKWVVVHDEMCTSFHLTSLALKGMLFELQGSIVYWLKCCFILKQRLQNLKFQLLTQWSEILSVVDPRPQCFQMILPERVCVPTSPTVFDLLSHPLFGTRVTHTKAHGSLLRVCEKVWGVASGKQ